MKFNVMKWVVPALFLGTIILASCGGKHPGFKEKNGTYYKIIPSAEANSAVQADSGVVYNLEMSYGTPDSLLLDFSKGNGQPVMLPFAKPDYPGDINDMLALLKKGDSAVFILQADSFYLNTARAPEVPEMFKKDNELWFYVKAVDIMTAEQIEAQRKKELTHYQIEGAEAVSKFMQANYPKAMIQPSGLYMIVEKKGHGRLPKEGDYANVDFSVSNLSGRVFYDSRKTKAPQDIQIGKKYDTEGFTEGLQQMRAGEEAVFVVPGHLAFGEQGRPGMINPFEGLKYWVRVNKIQSEAQYEAEQKKRRKAEKIALEQQQKAESKILATYLVDNKITAEPTPSGLIFIEKVAGTGKQAMAGKKVKVHYKGTLLDGTPFDSSYDRNAPFEFTLGQGQVIAGWDEALGMMKEGGKAEIIIPSNLAYGARGAGAIIKPYSPLKFEVELIEVNDAE